MRRPQTAIKLSHAHAILWEIDMLRFAADGTQDQSNWDRWRSLESFLLHFRNLIEFFGNPKPQTDTLAISRPATLRPDQSTRPTDAQLAQLDGKALWEKYERPPSNDKISKYLHHCTEQRVLSKEWRVREMLDEIGALRDRFEALLPDKSRPWGHAPTAAHSASPPESLGTPTVTVYPAPLGLSPIDTPVHVVREPNRD